MTHGEPMKPSTLAFLVVLAVVVGAAAPAPAVVIPGGGNPKSDCYVGFEVAGASNTNGATANGPRKAEQSACNGSCTFAVQICVNEPAGACTPASVKSISVKTPGVSLPLPPLPGSEHACGAAATFTVPLKGKKHNKPGKMKIKVVSASDGRPRNDPDILVLRCLPNPGNTGCQVGTTTSSTIPSNVVCEPIVPEQPIPGTYNLLGVSGPKICQTGAPSNVFGPCNSDADCGGGQGNCAPTPLVTADSTVLAFPTGISTTFTIAAEATAAEGCSHTACIQCGNPDGACAGIPGCGTTPGTLEGGCVKNTCCDTPGFVLPTFFVPLIGGLCSRLDMYACGTGVVNTSNPQVGDNELIKMADTSDPGPDCQYGTADDPPNKACTNAGAGSDTKGKIVRTLGNGAFDANGIQYRLATPGLSTTWSDSQSPQGTCANGSTFDPGELLISQILINAELTTAGATAGFVDMNGDNCALAGAGFRLDQPGRPKAGPITVPAPPAAPQPYDGSAGSTAVAAGFALSGSAPLYDIGFVAVEPNGPITRVTPTQSCSCTPVQGCPE